MGVEIQLHGNPCTAEYTAGKKLKEILTRDLNSNISGYIYICSNILKYEGECREIDLVVFGQLEGAELDIAHDSSPQRKIRLKSFCFTIEVKDHPQDKVQFSGNKVTVYYSGKKHDATAQAEKQKITLINFIKKFSEKMRHAPSFTYVVNFIWLRNIPEDVLQRRIPINYDLEDLNILPQNFKIESLFRLATMQYLIKKNNIFQTFGSLNSNKQFLMDFKEALAGDRSEPDYMTRKRIEFIFDNLTEEMSSIKQHVGKELVIFRGNAGTGKTTNLLKLACSLVNEGKRCLFLSYNNALISDIKRILYFRNEIPTGFNECIELSTIHSWVKGIAEGFGLHDDSTNFLEKYRYICKEITEYIAGEVITEEDMVDLMSHQPDLIQWDHVFIDEAQDFRIEEKELLFQIFGYDKLVIADGIEQFVRGGACNWSKNIPTFIHLEERCLRQKFNLARLSHYYAQSIGVKRCGKPMEDFHGGNALISKQLYPINDILILRNRCKSQGNKPYEILFLVPPDCVNDYGFSAIEDFLKSGIEIWDGSRSDIKRESVCRLEHHRLFQYDSCRGLEGWIVICIAFDEFLRYKYNTYKNFECDTDLVMADENEMRQDFVNRWVMMVITRSIDTLMITLKYPESKEAKLILQFASKHPDLLQISE